MPNKPRPLGNVAKETLQDADMQLASAFVDLRELVNVADLAIIERRYIASRAQLKISEVRRLIGTVLSLRE